MIKSNTNQISMLNAKNLSAISGKNADEKMQLKINFKTIFFVYIPLAVIAVLFIPWVRHALDAEMSLKMLVQIPALTILSFILGLQISGIKAKNILSKFFETVRRNGASTLVFLFGSQTFWMLPRSLDLAVYNETAGLLLYANLVAAGFFFGAGFRHTSFVLKTAFSIYGLSMALSMGIVYIHFNALICAVYTVEMQHEAGKYALYVFPFVFILFLYRLFYNMARLTEIGSSGVKTSGVMRDHVPH